MFRLAPVATNTTSSSSSRPREIENGKRRPSIQKVVTKARRTILGSLDQNQGRPLNEASSAKKQSILMALRSGKKAEPSTEPRAHVTKPEIPSPQIDRHYEQDPQQVSEFAKDIYDNVRESELRHRPSNNYMTTTQDEVTDSMRGILVDWLIDVHYKYGLHTETLFLAINVIDRFLSATKISRSKLQLVGVTGLLIAAKYEEIYPPSIRKLKEICADIYSKEDIIEMEAYMLDILRYDLTVVTPFQFLSRFWKVACNDEHPNSVVPKDSDCQIILKDMMFYICELSLVDYEASVRFLPSVTSAASLFIAMKVAHAIEHQKEAEHTTDDDIWNEHMHYYTGYRLKDIQPCISHLTQLVEKERTKALTNSQKLNTLRKKWSRSSRSRVATFLPEQYHLILY